MCRYQLNRGGGVAARDILDSWPGEAQPHRTARGKAAEESSTAGRKAAEKSSTTDRKGALACGIGESGGTSERGYTVIEVVVVLLVMTIAAAFIVPQVINYMRAYRLGVAARNVATALQRARYIATSNNTRAEISVQDAGMIHIIQYDTQGNTDPKDVGQVLLPDGITISPNAPRNLAFDGRGVLTPLPAQSPTIQINGPSTYYSIITVSPTGQVTVGPVQTGES